MNIKNIRTKNDLKDLVIDDWGYLDTGDLPTGIRLNKETKNKIIESNLIAEHKSFHILYFSLDENKKSETQTIDGFMRSTEREIINSVDKQERRTKLFVFSSSDGKTWHFVNVLPTSQINLRRFTIQDDNRDKLRTASEQLSKLQVTQSDSLQDVVSKHETAFDIEEVTTKFFQIFSKKFVELMDLISKVKKGIDKKEIADTAQIILNRILFLKFIERKGWLDGDKNYLYNRFQDYYKEEHFYWQEIICPLFDNLSSKHNNPVPEIGNIPFLNGGLFGNEPKNLFTLYIPNDYFLSLFDDLLNHFNFTIEESSPSSIEVAVDPEMLGRIFEALILTIEKSDNLEQDLRRATGAYYTPRTVVFHMSRIAIAKSLSHKTGIDELKIKKLIDLSIDEIPDEKQIKDCPISKQEAGNLLGKAKEIAICDPAVGSGAFLLISLQILSGMRKYLKLYLEEEIDEDYNLKEEIIRDNLIGVDILKQAVHICELRLWLSLVVDYSANRPEEVPTLPNLTYRIFHGDSIVDHIEDQQSEELENYRRNYIKYRKLSADASTLQNLERLKTLKKNFFHLADESVKEQKNKEINKKKLEISLEILKKDRKTSETKQTSWIPEPEQQKFTLEDIKKQGENIVRSEMITYIEKLLRHNLDPSESEKLNFTWLVDLVEFFIDRGKSGFDIVIGNPPYGLKNESMVKGKERYDLGSKDSFGVFMTLAIKELLKVNGVLSFITSDTWQTIKTHKQLRRLILENMKVHEILMMPSWIFGATVNTSIFVTTKVNKGKVLRKEDGWNIFENTEEIRKNELIACDFIRADKKKSELEEYLYSLDNPRFYSSKDVAFYKYHQGLILLNSNIPFFVASPKLFQLMNDTTCDVVEKEIGEKEKKKVSVRQIKFNGKTIELLRFGDIADIKQGLATGDNKYYLFQNPNTRGSYKSINEYKQHLLNDDEIYKINKNNELRLKVIENGIHKSKNEKGFDKDLWFGGRFIVPYDKGGESDTGSGWLPNYYVPTNYFIDWNQDAVNRLKTLTTKQRNKLLGEKGGDNRLCSRFQNRECYFKRGLTFSWAGVYCPTFRINSGGPFDHGSSDIFCENTKLEFLLGILCSKIIRFLSRAIINHSINYGIDDVKDIPIVVESDKSITSLVDKIISKQEKGESYDYMSNEQKEIDKKVYKIYGLNNEDIKEVERWYARRYPKLEKYCDIK